MRSIAKSTHATFITTDKLRAKSADTVHSVFDSKKVNVTRERLALKANLKAIYLILPGSLNVVLRLINFWGKSRKN